MPHISTTPRISEAARRAFREAGYFRADTVGGLLDRKAADDGERPAVIDGGRAVTYRELAAESLSLARALRARGIGAGDVVAIQLPNTLDFLLLYYALARLGAVLSTIHMPYRIGEIEPLLAHGGARAIVCAPAAGRYDAPATMLALAGRLDALDTVIVAGPAAPEGAIALDDIRRDAGDPAPIAGPAPEDPLVLAFTSGTVAQPKTIVRDHESMLANNCQIAEIVALGNRDVVVSAPPFTHVYGLCVNNLCLAAGAANALMAQFTPPVLAGLIESVRATMLFAAPAHVAAILAAGLDRQHDLGSLRVSFIAGSPLSVELARAWEKVTGSGVVNQMFGMTETIMSMILPNDDPAEIRHTKVGRAVPGIEARVTDPDGRPLEAGREGELEFRGYSVFAGYFGNDQATRESFRDGGWYRTGDLAVADEAGNVVLTGRLKDIINRGAVKINPSDIEALIDRHPAVDQSAIAPMPDPILGEKACLFVTLKPGAALTLEDVCGYLAEHDVAKLKWPERLVVVDEMPLTPTRKIIKARLAALVAKG